MSVRDMNGDPSLWEEFNWDDLSAEEQELWTALGWNERIWNTEVNVPMTADMEWKHLTTEQRFAATRLGFTESLWDGYEDQ